MPEKTVSPEERRNQMLNVLSCQHCNRRDDPYNLYKDTHKGDPVVKCDTCDTIKYRPMHG